MPSHAPLETLCRDTDATFVQTMFVDLTGKPRAKLAQRAVGVETEEIDCSEVSELWPWDT